MPWKETTKMVQRGELIEKWRSRTYGVSELAEWFGVSRPTVYQWIARYEESGPEGLVDRPSIPKSCPHRTTDEIAEAIIAAKRAGSDWGPQKLIDYLRREKPNVAWPAPSTAGRILESEGLVKKRRKRRGLSLHHVCRLSASESGEMMTTDHKGEFRLGNRQYCYPLTIADPVSRFVYRLDALDSRSIERARPGFEKVFREYGIPWFVGSDNGGPFCCSRALGGLTRLAVWWIRMGITPVRIHPGCPWENGIHERMHKTLKAETTRPPAETMAGQQKRFDEFRDVFNHVRPHEALDGRSPATELRACARPYPERLLPIEYPGHFEVRRVRPAGQIKWQGGLLFISQALAGEWIGLQEIDDGVWSIYFAAVELGRYDEKTNSIS